MISGEGLGKRFGRRWVFRRVEFCVARGECLLVTGANGSGKSTLLRILAGLEPASEGSVSRSFSGEVGFSSPELRVYPWLTGREHLEIAARLRGLTDASLDLLRLVGLDGDDKVAGQYSTGMKGRLKLALAIQAQPEVLLLDEPGAGLDESGLAIVNWIVEEQKLKGAVVIATNDPNERRFGDLELRLGD